VKELPWSIVPIIERVLPSAAVHHLCNGALEGGGPAL
jgi:hypothetical protein